MSKLTEFITKLSEYGAVKIYEINNQINIGIKYVIKIDNNGNLLINDDIASMKSTINLISYLTYVSIYKKINIKPMVLDYKPNTDNVIPNLIDIISSILKSIKYKDISDTIIGGEFAFIDDISKREIVIKNGSLEEIDNLLNYLENLLYTAFFVWKEMQDASNVNDYKIARERWDKFASDTMIIENTPER